ncbi:MAG: SseB family protein [Betaproteobacteria bacterium]|nr:SseB family protein [Betaproteobacteria bacterium]
MHDEPFEARNELEQKLLAAMSGELSSDEFMQELMAGQVFIPVKDDEDSGIKGFQRTTRATPLVVEDEGGASVMVVFTSPERALEFLEDVPGYSGGLLAEFTWILERIQPGIAITVNPGLEAGIDVEPAIITRMIELMAARAPRN